MLTKNQICNVEITDIGNKGEGIGRYDNFVIFADNCVPGDICEIKILKAKKSFAYGKVMRIIKASPHRVEAFCPVAGKCGGCQLMHLSYEEQLRFKEKKVKDSLVRIGHITDPCILPIEPMENRQGYRNKVQVPVRQDKGQIKMGYYAKNSHHVVENRECYIQDGAVEQILGHVYDYMAANTLAAYDEESGKGLVRHVMVKKGFETGEILICIVLNAKNNHLPKNWEQLASVLSAVEGVKSICFNYNSKQTNVVLGDYDRFIWGELFITDKLGGYAFKISPHSFYQVNAVQAEKMYRCALSFAGLTGKETVIDAYCGTGTIGIFFAGESAKVYGMEIVPQAVEDAVYNAKQNNTANIEFMLGKAEELITDFMDRGTSVDVIIADPPRKGCELAFLEAVAQLKPEKFIYISCNPDTLARDAEIMAGFGYQLEKARPFDMFCFSTHVETVCLFTK